MQFLWRVQGEAAAMVLAMAFAAVAYLEEAGVMPEWASTITNLRAPYRSLHCHVTDERCGTAHQGPLTAVTLPLGVTHVWCEACWQYIERPPSTAKAG